MPVDPPEISVGMPVYNGEAWIQDAVRSILDQTFPDLELIISDNASTDGTEAICRQLARTDRRVRYVRLPVNLGASANYNRVFDISRGRFFKWASCNDWCDPAFLATCREVLEEDRDVVLAYPRTALFEGDPANGTPYEDNLHLAQDSAVDRFISFLERVRLNNVMNGLIRTQVLQRTPLIRPYFASDTWLMAELALAGKFVEVPLLGFFRRMDPDSATARKTQEEVVRHWKPDLRPVLFSETRGLMQHFGAVSRARIAYRDKLRLWGYLARKSAWSRRKILAEARQGLMYATGRQA